MKSEERRELFLPVLLLMALTVVVGSSLYLIRTLATDVKTGKAVIAEQAESIMALEQNVKLLRAEVTQLRTERDEAVGELRALKSVIPTSRSADRPKLTLQEMRELAGTVHVEARGEPPDGKMMVAKVALNRLRWNPGKTLHQILTREGAFANGKDYESADMAAVFDAMADREYDHVAGFHNPDTATAEDAKKRVILFRIGDHVFW